MDTETKSGIVVAGGGTLEVGKEYECRNSRNGTFAMRVTSVSDCWITGTVTQGEAGAILAYNMRGLGEEVTVRDEHSYFVLLPQK